MIKAVIFDFAGVIVPEGYWNWLYKNILDIANKETHFIDLSRKVDSSQITTQEFLTDLSKESGKDEKTIEKEIFSEFILNTDLLVMIEKLKQKYKIGFLSNFLGDWIEKLFLTYDLKKYFDSVVVSTQVGGVIKPNPEIYRIILNRLDVKPNEALFIDDRLPNINGAKKVGMMGIVFKSNTQLKKDLLEMGIAFT